MLWRRVNDKGGVVIIVWQVVCALGVSRLTSLNKQVREPGTEEATSSPAQESQQDQNETDELDNDEPRVEHSLLKAVVKQEGVQEEVQV